jgi:ABC-type sulfate transport system permease component
VNLSNNETETAGVILPSGQFLPVLPVLSYTYHASPATLTAAVNDANNGASTLTTLGVTGPIAAAAVGFVLMLVAAFLWMRGSGRGHTAETPRPERHPAPAGR